MEEKGNTAPTLALARRSPDVAIEHGLDAMAFEPRSIEEAMQVAKWVAESRFFTQLQTPEQAFLVIATGRELRIGFMAALRCILVIKSKEKEGKEPEPPKLAMLAQLKTALARRDPSVEWMRCSHDPTLKGNDPTYAEWQLKKVGDDFIYRAQYSIDEARKAGYLGGEYKWNGETRRWPAKKNWIEQPENMCFWRAASRLADREVSHALLGLPTGDELEGPVIDIPGPYTSGADNGGASIPATTKTDPIRQRISVAAAGLETAEHELGIEAFRKITGASTRELRETTLADMEDAVERLAHASNESLREAQPPSATPSTPPLGTSPPGAAPTSSSPKRDGDDGGGGKAPPTSKAKDLGPDTNRDPGPTQKQPADGIKPNTTAAAPSGAVPPDSGPVPEIRELANAANDAGVNLFETSLGMFERPPKALSDDEKRRLLSNLKGRAVTREARDGQKGGRS